MTERKSELQVACDELDIEIESIYIGLRPPTDDEIKACKARGFKAYPNDEWVCVLKFEDRSERFSYLTGVGHRKPKPGVEKVGLYGNEHYMTPKGNLRFDEALNEGYFRTVLPSLADVLSNLLSEVSACDVSFNNWCDEYGGNNDSIKALKTYHACQENGDKIRRLLGHQLVNELSQKEH